MNRESGVHRESKVKLTVSYRVQGKGLGEGGLLWRGEKEGEAGKEKGNNEPIVGCSGHQAHVHWGDKGVHMNRPRDEPDVGIRGQEH